MKQTILILGIIFLLIGCTTTQTQPIINNNQQVISNKPQFAQYGVDQASTGRSPFVGPTNPGIKWQYLMADTIHGRHVLIGADETLFIVIKDKLVAMNKDGSVKWEADNPNYYALPALGKDDVYVGSESSLRSFDQKTGKPSWEFNVPGNIDMQLLIADDGTIYFGSVGEEKDEENAIDAIYYALNSDGTKKWSSTFPKGANIYASAIGPDGTIYVAGDKLRALNPTDGSIKWEFDAAGLNGLFGPAVGDEGIIYFGSNNGGPTKEESRFYAINPDGTEKWSLLTGFIETSPAIGYDGTIYFHNYEYREGVTGDYPRGVHAVNPDGTKKWSHNIQCPDWDPFKNAGSDSSILVDPEGSIYFGTECSVVYALKSDGTLKWSASIGSEFDNRPTIGKDGTLYICHAGGGIGDYWLGHYRCYALSDGGKEIIEPETLTHFEYFKKLCEDGGETAEVCNTQAYSDVMKKCNLRCMDVETDQTDITKQQCLADCPMELGLMGEQKTEKSCIDNCMALGESKEECSLVCTGSEEGTGDETEPEDSTVSSTNQPCTTQEGESGKTCDSVNHCSSGEFIGTCCIMGTCSN